MKPLEIEVEINIPQDVAVSFLTDIYKNQRRETTPPEIIQEQRELLKLVRNDRK